MLALSHLRAFDAAQLFFVQFRHQDLAGEELAGLRQCFFIASHHDVEVVVACPNLAGCVQFAEFLFQLLGFVGTHDAGIVHQFGSKTEFGEFAFAHTVAQGKAEYVVLGILRVVHLGTVVQLLGFHIAEVDELLVYMSDRHALELRGIERLFAYRRFNGLISRFLYLVALVQLTFFYIESEIVVGQILLGHTLDVFGGDGHYFFFVVEYLTQILFVDKGIQQDVPFVVIGLHAEVEVAAHIVFDGFDLPLLKFTVGNLLDGFQSLLLSALVGFEATLVFIIQRNALDDVTSLFAQR